MSGYKEVIETVIWGLQQLGHSVTYKLNSAVYGDDTTNIVFGAQVISEASQKQLPDNTIIYNFEQLRGVAENVRAEILHYAKHFRIWDYCEGNFPTWKTIGTRYPVQHVPVGYAPVLSRIPKPALQDIDVLIYGLSGDNRLKVFHELSVRGASVVFVSGLYGLARDDLIARAKIVLNINLYGAQKIFEIVRVSYLLANKKAVVADLHPDTYVEKGLSEVVTFLPVEYVAKGCLQLLEDSTQRERIEEQGFAEIQKRDIRKILQNVPLA